MLGTIMNRMQFALPLAASLLLFACDDVDRSGTKPKTPLEESAKQASPSLSGNFGVTIEAPATWHRMSNAESDGMMDTGRELIAGDDENMGRMLESSRDNGKVLFSYFEHPPGTPIEFNASVIASAENVSLAPGIQRGSDYLFHMRRMLANSGIVAEFSDGAEETRIDGEVFDSMRTTMQINGLTVHQQVQAARHGDYVISIVRSWMTSEQDAATLALINSIKLDW